ncbi:hypothetical protein BOX15_Mlig013187g1 [Macrostomum lignano]|uniref:Uncharacterized protein n=2 Tax=Macrostomum lignano TaxID=282301 RepID=A0A267E232_9PLAT|nr:hypothetical protein BOX15_Mlig013187g2 [Macrostomum lignano]PAA55496.1 hypothetical protein BOX15_Mlig013187g1 [Macrostomum lignano]
MSQTAPFIYLLRLAASVAVAAAAFTDPSGMRCPCAYLERGGFWDSPTAVSLGVSDRVYRERRCSCQHEVNCDWSWITTDKSITLTWLGSEDIRDSEIQLQFCAPIFRPGAPFCPTSGGGAFALRQTGWWIDLHEAPRCRCAAETGPASIRRFRYAEPLEMGERLRNQIVEFACGRMPPCDAAQACYGESLNKQGRRTGGQVLCTCPPDTYCPVYTGQGARTVPADPTPETSSNSTAEVAEELSDTGQRIELLCVTAGP